MTLKVCQLLSIILSAMVAGIFCGPWVALTRSLSAFNPALFLAIVNRMSRNLAPAMTILMPAAVLSMVPILFISYRYQPSTFFLTLAAAILFIVALLVTVIVEVPIVKQIETWKVATMPGNWQQLRDRWQAFHVVRIVVSLAGLILVVTGAIF